MMSSTSFFFYDLETSGVNSREARIMQFAGQRTDMDLRPIGDPVNVLIRISDDILPDPDAILITGITPQQTIMDGITEVEFLRLFHEQVATPGTIFVGYNTVRFDDEFMRYLHYRNFYDPYEWQYVDNKSRWDLLDVVRMMRALRPDGINWPVTEEGKPTNRLELLTKANGIDHDNAHDALSDVMGTIYLAQLIKEKQPKLFEYLLGVRDKKAVTDFVSKGQPFLYSSGKYATEYEKTAAVGTVAMHPRRAAALVFNLRYDPTEYQNMSAEDLAELWRYKPGEGIRLPVKTMQFNRCPAIAPLGVLDEASETRLGITKQQAVERYKQMLASDFAATLLAALEILDAEQEKNQQSKNLEAEARLYDGFFSPSDRQHLGVIRTADPNELSGLSASLKDKRLIELLPHYKARNFRTSLTDEERLTWESYRNKQLLEGGPKSKLAKFFARLTELASEPDISSSNQYLLEELQLYGQSLMPTHEA